MKYALLFWALVCSVTPCFAQQQQDDPEYLKHAIAVLQAQRNNAFDGQVVLESKLAQTNKQVDELKLKVKGLEDKLNESKKE